MILFMQTASILNDFVQRTLSGEVVTSSPGEGRSSRSAQRAVFDLLGSHPLELAAATDANGLPQRARILEAIRSWAARKRLVVEVCEYKTVSVEQEKIDLIILSDNRGRRTWRLVDEDVVQALLQISAHRGKKLWLVPTGQLCTLAAELFQSGQHLALEQSLEFLDQAIWPEPYVPESWNSLGLALDPTENLSATDRANSYLDELERESIGILREAVASGRKTCMLFSMGKDSMVMLRLAQKAFAPNPIPFPLVVIDTRWKFQDMYRFRNFVESQADLNVIVHVNPEAIERDVNPFDFGSATHTQITKTEALRQVLDENGFEMIFGGGRRDEERSRAKERLFSVRGSGHTWNPREQRPELWSSYNTVLADGQTMRVFPISNWTELDIWRYIEREQIPLVPLYFAKRRALVSRNSAMLAVDDERIELEDGERVEFEWVRFRTLGCYPLTGAAYSRATSVSEIVRELEDSDTSERISRVIDFDAGASMEQKKREGYF